MENLVTVKTFTYAHEAAIAKSLLSSEDIFCFLKDELTIQANPFYSNALGGVKLQVREREFAKAAGILKDAGYSDEPKKISLKNETGTLSECPACGSDELSLIKKQSGTIFGLSLLLLGFPLPVFSRIYHCYGCGSDISISRIKEGDRS